MNQAQIKNTLVQYQDEMETLSKKAERVKGSLENDFKKLNELLNAGEPSKSTEDELLHEAYAVLETLQKSIEETNERLITLMEEIEEEYTKIQEDDDES